MAIAIKNRAVTLDSVQAGEGDEILPDFPVIVDGEQVWVTAVLDRTVIVEPAPGEPKVLVNRRRCLVDPAVLRFRPSVARHAARRGREMARKNRAQQETAA